MSNAKVVMGQASNTLAKPLEVEDVFSTYLYEGTGAAQTITNGIDLDGEGGLVWVKNRDTTDFHHLCDTERGSGKILFSNSTNGQVTNNNTISGFSSSGFSLGSDTAVSTNNEDYASWTFRKAPKFFDVVTYTGDGVAGREIAHNLGSVPGCFILKATSTTGDWIVYHRGLSDPSNKALALHLTNAELDNTYFNDTDPTATHFVVGGQGLGINNTGVTYVAYLFAHNDDDGEFGPDGDADIIKCGSYTGNNSTNGPEIDLGFEPQWIMIKNATASQSWWMFDTMRGIVTSSNGADDARLRADGSVAEDTQNRLHVTSTGFKLTASSSDVNDSNTFIYIAIRRGTKVPESATEVFDVASALAPLPTYDASFAVDMAIRRNVSVSSDNLIVSRLTGTKTLETNESAVEGTNSGLGQFDFMNGFASDGGTSPTKYGWMWKRAPGFFDVVAYTGAGANTVVNHNLNAIPEMALVKNRGRAQNWNVYHKDLVLGSSDDTECRLFLNTTSAVSAGATFWGAHTDTTFVTGVQNFQTNYPNDTYIAYLFASLPGISKVGSYTGTGTSLSIDCGFTSGARFVLIKRTDQAFDWFVWDTERGITTSYDPVLSLNTTAAELSLSNTLNPYSPGFQIIDNYSGVNENGGSYIFYAIA